MKTRLVLATHYLIFPLCFLEVIGLWIAYALFTFPPCLGERDVSNFILSRWILHAFLSDSLCYLYTTSDFGIAWILSPSTMGRCLAWGLPRGFLFILMWYWQCLKTLLPGTRSSRDLPMSANWNYGHFRSWCFKAKNRKSLIVWWYAGLYAKVAIENSTFQLFWLY